MKTKIRGILLFAAGLLTAFIVQFIYPPPQDAMADSYSCIRNALKAQGMTGNIPDPEFTITYDVPSCYGDNHYTVQRVYIYGDQVAVHYATTE